MSSHSHSHQNPKTDEFHWPFMISIGANGVFVVFQVFFALWANSTSLLADAFHNFGDVLSLILAWVATVLMKRQPNHKATFGLKKTSILAALINGILLVFTCGIIAAEAINKFANPESVHAIPVMIVASIGILVNGATALLFMKGSKDLNIRGAFLHLVYDALVSFGVVLSAGLLYLTHWLWIDPLVGLIIAWVILKGTWGLFKDSFRLIIDAVPRDISLMAVKDDLLKVSGVEGLHDLHIWALSTQENALSVHLYMPNQPLSDKQRIDLVKQLKADHELHHITIQIEETQSCCLAECNFHD